MNQGRTDARDADGEQAGTIEAISAERSRRRTCRPGTQPHPSKLFLRPDADYPLYRSAISEQSYATSVSIGTAGVARSAAVVLRSRLEATRSIVR
jgi:hypothetical protein